tara:strand:+ start:677 stop:1486 length:810 start_codon:yes stop_codon:yes gene_type:complete
MIFLLSIAFIQSKAHARSSFDRCVVHHCTCEVSATKLPKKYSKVIIPNETIVYFEEDSYETSNESMSDLKKFITFHSPKVVRVTGYTDGCGSHEYNKDLANNRAKEIKKQIYKIAPNAIVYVKIVGEEVSNHEAHARKVKVSITSSYSVSSSIQKIPADFYLLDASHSMAKKHADKWKEMIAASYRPGTKIFVSMTNGCSNKQSLASITPQGGTEIWYSYWWLLDHMKPGQTLLIISDFDSNVPLSYQGYKIIENKVRDKGIKVYDIRL